MNEKDRSSDEQARFRCDSQAKLKDILSKRFKQLRLSKNMAVSEMARKTGISRVSLSRIESGEQLPQLPVIYDVCYKLNLKLNDLLPSPDEIYKADLSIENLEEKKLRSEILKAQSEDV